MAVLTRQSNRCAAIHPEAADWARRVGVNGGGVNSGTIAAVSRFCRDIDNAGLRSVFYRLNLFAGTGLSAALVPLYRNTSPFGGIVGNATDANSGFGASDYNELSGLVGSTTKSLQTGVPLNFAASRHIAAIPNGTMGLTGQYLIGGVAGSGINSLFGIYAQSFTNTTVFNADDSGNLQSAGNTTITPYRTIVANSISGGALQLAIAGSVVATGTANTTATTSGISVFGYAQPSGTVLGKTTARLGGYSIGGVLTAPQLAAYDAAILAFNVAMGRQDHAEALDWSSRVTTNGGSVSPTTLAAVSNFCKDINSFSIRDRFLRLNLFAGTGLSAALVPLYRNSSFGGSVIGNSTDTNFNLVSGDYVETTGLTAGTAGKYIDTGVTSSQLPANVGHWAYSVINSSFVSTGYMIGCNPSTNYRLYSYVSNATSNTASTASANFIETNSPVSIYVRTMLSRTSPTSLILYRQGSISQANATTATSTTGSTDTVVVFGANPGGGCRAGLHYYSLGDAMTSSQAALADAAFFAFIGTMGRS